MIKKYIALCFFSCSLIAMEPILESYNIKHMMVFVGNNRPFIPLSDVIQTFPKLAATLMQAGYVSKKENNYKWVYGTDDTIFLQEQKDALWFFNDTEKHFIRRIIPCETLWKHLYIINQWLPESKTVGYTIIDNLINEESMCPPLPTGNNWNNSYNIVSSWLKKGTDKKSNYYVIATPDGSLKWHNHSLALPCHCLNPIVIPTFAFRYCQLNPKSKQAFTKEHVQQFCNKKALKDIALDENEINLTVIFKDNTQILFKRDNPQSEWKTSQN